MTESAPALTAPAAVETPLEIPLTTFLIALFRRPSFLFLGASEEPEEEDPPDPAPDPDEEPPEDEEELEEDPPPEEEPPSDDEEEEEGFPPGPYLPLSYPFLAALLTALAALVPFLLLLRQLLHHLVLLYLLS